MSTLEEIANGVTSNVFTAGSSAALASLQTDIFDAICSGGQRIDSPEWVVKDIVNRFIYEAASKYKNKFSAIPNWIPDFALWKDGQIPFFSYKRKN